MSSNLTPVTSVSTTTTNTNSNRFSSATAPLPQSPTSYTYQIPVSHGNRVTYVTSTYYYPQPTKPKDAKRPLMKRIIRFIKYGPVD